MVARVDICAGSELIGKNVPWLRSEHATFVLEHRNGGSITAMPGSSLAFGEGDRLTVQCDLPTLRHLHALAGDDETL